MQRTGHVGPCSTATAPPVQPENRVTAGVHSSQPPPSQLNISPEHPPPQPSPSSTTQPNTKQHPTRPFPRKRSSPPHLARAHLLIGGGGHASLLQAVRKSVSHPPVELGAHVCARRVHFPRILLMRIMSPPPTVELGTEGVVCR